MEDHKHAGEREIKMAEDEDGGASESVDYGHLADVPPMQDPDIAQRDESLNVPPIGENSNLNMSIPPGGPSPFLDKADLEFWVQKEEEWRLKEEQRRVKEEMLLSQIKQLEKNNKMLQSDAVDLSGKLGKTLGDLNERKKENQTLRNNLEKANINLLKQKKEYEGVIQQLKIVSERESELLTQLQSKNEKLEEVNTNNENLRSVLAEMESLRAVEPINEEKHNGLVLNDVFDQSEEVLGALNEENNKLKAEIDSFKKEKLDLTRALEKEKFEHEKDRRIVDNLPAMKSNFQSQNNQLQRKLDEIKSELAVTREELEKTTKEKENYDRKLKSVSKKADDLSQENKALQKKETMFKEDLEQVKEAMEKNAMNHEKELQEARQKSEKTNNTLKKKLGEFFEQNKNNKKNIKNLEAEKEDYLKEKAHQEGRIQALEADRNKLSLMNKQQAEKIKQLEKQTPVSISSIPAGLVAPDPVPNQNLFSADNKHQDDMDIKTMLFKLVDCCENGPDEEKKVRIYTQVAELGDATTQVALANYYRRGAGGLEKDEKEALRLYQSAADQKHARARYFLAEYHRYGIGGLKEDMFETIYLYKSLVKEKNADAQYELGYYYWHGIGVGRNRNEAIRLFRLAADQHEPESLYHLADCYQYGMGVEKNEYEAARLYQLAAAGVTESGFQDESVQEVVERLLKLACEDDRDIFINEINRLKRNHKESVERLEKFIEICKHFTDKLIKEKSPLIGSLKLYECRAKESSTYTQEIVDAIKKSANVSMMAEAKEADVQADFITLPALSGSTPPSTSQTLSALPVVSLNEPGTMALEAERLLKEAEEKNWDHSTLQAFSNNCKSYGGAKGLDKLVQVAHKIIELLKEKQDSYRKTYGEEATKIKIFELTNYRSKLKKIYGEALNQLGLCYWGGRNGVKENQQEAVRLLKLAVDEECAAGQWNMGTVYRDGFWGLEKNACEAAYFYRLAADQGYRDAQYSLGRLYDLGSVGVCKNMDKAAALLKLAAKQGMFRAEIMLAEYYRHGRGGLKKDLAEMIRLLELSIEHGGIDGLVNLGYYHWHGIGVDKNETKAVEYYKRAKDKGSTDVEALNNLADCYLYGMGVEKDEKQAVQLYYLAAVQGCPLSQHALWVCYQNGIEITTEQKQQAEQYQPKEDRAIDEIVEDLVKRAGEKEDVLDIMNELEIDKSVRGLETNIRVNQAFIQRLEALPPSEEYEEYKETASEFCAYAVRILEIVKQAPRPVIAVEEKCDLPSDQVAQTNVCADISATTLPVAAAPLVSPAPISSASLLGKFGVSGEWQQPSDAINNNPHKNLS